MQVKGVNAHLSSSGQATTGRRERGTEKGKGGWRTVAASGAELVTFHSVTSVKRLGQKLARKTIYETVRIVEQQRESEVGRRKEKGGEEKGLQNQ